MPVSIPRHQGVLLDHRPRSPSCLKAVESAIVSFANSAAAACSCRDRPSPAPTPSAEHGMTRGVISRGAAISTSVQVVGAPTQPQTARPAGPPGPLLGSLWSATWPRTSRQSRAIACSNIRGSPGLTAAVTGLCDAVAMTIL